MIIIIIIILCIVSVSNAMTEINIHCATSDFQGTRALIRRFRFSRGEDIIITALSVIVYVCDFRKFDYSSLVFALCESKRQ